ncbi:MAG: hypothetical protein JWN72_2913 [Thermoleophilia bacterium]|nr:hypothetical protein [Thermoleophilia bacterium]
MRTRTFIGMIILILALIVASTPPLLDVVSKGVQAGAHKAGVPGVDAVAAAPDSRKPAKAAGGTVDPRLELKGYTQTGADLRDGYSTAERAATQGYRLATGTHRQLMPGQLSEATAASPPLTGAEGVLLDSDGCPLLRPGADSTQVLATPEAKQLYADKVASADDPASCRATFTARTTAADPSKATPASERLLRELGPGAVRRQDATELLMAKAYYTMLDGMFATGASDKAWAELTK